MMRLYLTLAVSVAVVALVVAGVAFAQGPMGWWSTMGPGMWGPGMMGPGMMGPGMMGWGHQGMMGPGMMGPGTGGGPGWYGCPGTGWYGQPAATQVTEERAKELAQQYADQYLKGFTVDKVLPFTGMGMTMYSVELKGPQGEVRTLHVNPWGNVMPFGGAWRRAG